MTKTDIIKNLYETYAYLKEYDPDYPLLKDMGELLNKVNSSQFENALQTLAVLEEQAAKTGIIENAGYFDALLEAWKVADLEGLGSWFSRQKDKVKSLSKKVAKYNPATFSARRALATLLSMNIYGYATKLKKDTKAYEAFMKKWKNMGGDEKYMANLLTKAAKKKPLLVKHINGIYTDELGAIYTSYINKAKPVLDYIERITAIKHVKSPARITKDIPKIYNPALAAFETLVKMNYKNYATLLHTRKDVYNAVEAYYKRMKGDINRLKSAIAIGYRHRPISGNLGVLADIKALLDMAKPVLDWIGKLLATNKTKTNSTKTSTNNKTSKNQPQQQTPSSSTKNAPTQRPTESYSTPTTRETKILSSNGKMKKLVGVGVAFLTGVAIYVVVKNKNDNKILSGIKFK